MRDVLAGTKSAFLWNWAAFDGDPAVAAGLLSRGGMTAVAVKSHDGSYWYSQGASIRAIRVQLVAAGVQLVGSWSYHYFQDPAGELERVRQCIEYGEVDYHILNIEDPEVERNPDTAAIADEMFDALRESYGDFPLYFCSHAQPAYHPQQPYFQAVEHDIAMMPMAYHTAMQVTPETSVRLTRDGLAAFDLDRVPANYAGALYGVPGWPIRQDDIGRWGRAAMEAGASGLTWWDLDECIHAPALLDAVRDLELVTCR